MGFCLSILKWVLLSSWVALAAHAAHAADYYVSTSGSDSNPGTVSAPFRTVPKAYSLATAGTTIYVRGGVYTLSTQFLFNKSGSAGNLIKIFNYPGERPVIDGINMGTDGWTKGAPVRITGHYNHFKGFEVKNGPEFGVAIDGSASHNIVENLNVHHTGRLSNYEGKGIVIHGSASNNLILNCDSHHNVDLRLGNADGFQVTSSGQGNILRGNRAWKNSDDGYDFWAAAPILFENNIAFENGYDDSMRRLGDGNGFKLGGHRSGGTSGGHVVRNNVAFRNAMHGFDQNDATRAMTLYNNTAWNNGFTMPGGVSWARNYYFYSNTNVFRNNLSFGDYGKDSGDSKFNSWNLPVTVNSSDFASLDTSLALQPRQADGSLPVSNFLRLVVGSDLIDKGVAVGHAYLGSAPDLGAYEYQATIAAPTPAPTPEPTPEPAPAPAPTPTLAGNLVVNSGFEDGLTHWNNWGGAISSSSSVKSGSYAVRVGTQGGGLGQNVKGLQPGKKYVFSANSRKAGSEYCEVTLMFRDSSNRAVAPATIMKVNTSSSYQFSRAEVTAPSSYDHVLVYVWKDGGSSYCYVDDISVTSDSDSATSEPAPAPTVTQIAIQNSGFEDGYTGWSDYGSTSVVSSPVNSGSSALQVYGEGGRGQSLSGLKPATSYVLTFAARRSYSGGEWCGVGISFGTSGDPVTKITSQGYSGHSLEFTTPSSLTGAKVYIWKDQGSNSCYLDDLTLVQK